MRLPRITLRRMMILVAVVGLLLGVTAEALKVMRKRAEYQRMAAMHAGEAIAISANGDRIFKARERQKLRVARELRGAMNALDYLIPGPRIPAAPSMIEKLDEMRNQELFSWERHKRLQKKYEDAARRPWLSLPPDPE